MGTANVVQQSCCWFEGLHHLSTCHAPIPLADLQETSFGNLWLAGDWVKGVQHGANGLSQASGQLKSVHALQAAGARPDAVSRGPLTHSPARLLQERALVTGLQAANLVCERLGQGRPADILPGAWARQAGHRPPLHASGLAGRMQLGGRQQGNNQ